ncbi:20177_t:CDS:2, partial [Gigaspora margarita]
CDLIEIPYDEDVDTARFRHTSLAMVDHYAGSFELRVFKNQYAIEFLLPTGERYRECE